MPRSEYLNFRVTKVNEPQIRMICADLGVDPDDRGSYTQAINFALMFTVSQKEQTSWWHWAVRLDAVRRVLGDIGAEIDVRRPWRGVNDDDKKVTSGYWRAQPWCDPGKESRAWFSEVEDLRAELDESAGVFYIEHVDTRPIFQSKGGGPRYDSGYLIAVSNDGVRVAFRKVI